MFGFAWRFYLLIKLLNLKSKVNLKHSNQQSFKMGTKQSSLAKSASTEQNEAEETPKLEVKELSGERGLLIVNHHQNIEVLSLEDEFGTETDSDDDSENESDDEEGMSMLF